MADIRTIISVLVLCLSGASGFADSVYVYTVDMTETHTVSISSSPYVTPTASGDGNLALPGCPIPDFVVGVSAGNMGDPCIPQHNLYAYMITDPCVTGQKTKVVIITGNHNTETSGSWAFQGMVDFLLSGEPEAVWLRKAAEFWVYPLVNPDGRYTQTGRGNPEIQAMLDGGQLPPEITSNDHNRLWHLSYPTDCGVSTIDALTTAMLTDSDACEAGIDYYFDFHGTDSTFFYTVPELMDCPYVEAFLALDTGVYPKARTAEQATLGSSRIWAMLEPPWGLGATYSFTPENDKYHDVSYFLDLGRYYGIALHNVLMPETLIGFADLEVLSSSWLENGIHQRQIGELIGWWEFDEGDGNTAADSSGYDNTGTLYDGNGNVIEDPNWQSGALVFDANTCVQTAYNANKLQLNSGYTWAAWIKADSTQTERAAIFDKYDPNTAGPGNNHWSLQFGVEHYIDTSDKIVVWNGAEFMDFWDTQIKLSEIAGDWHHIAVVRSVNTMASFLDGNSVNCGKYTTNPISGAGLLNIGADRRLQNFYKGLIDDIQVYDYQLSSDEIELLYQDLTLPSSPAEEVYYCYPTGDLNEDYKVNHRDFSVLALEWLESSIK